MKKIKLGFAVCGSFCNMENTMVQMEKLADIGYKITPIMSFNASGIDTRFGKAQDFKKRAEQICQTKVINTIKDAEPIGPKDMIDILLIAPCTGNTLGKICCAITDTPVVMAAKSQLRVNKPVLLALATNDALGLSAQNIGKAINMKNIYFVPMKQDDPEKKPHSMVAEFNLIPQSIELALNAKQKQPIFL